MTARKVMTTKEQEDDDVTDLQLLAQRYRAAERKLGQAREVLYAEIRAASARGLSYREIATATGLSFPRVQQIVMAQHEVPVR